MLFQRITIIKINKPKVQKLNDGLQWLGNSLGLFSLRDKDKSCFRIFIELLKAAKRGKTLSSDEIAFHLNLTRGTVIHHVNRLMEAGLVVGARGGYILRVENLGHLIDELRRDIDATIDELKFVAKEIDEELGI